MILLAIQNQYFFNPQSRRPESIDMPPVHNCPHNKGSQQDQGNLSAEADYNDEIHHHLWCACSAIAQWKKRTFEDQVVSQSTKPKVGCGNLCPLPSLWTTCTFLRQDLRTDNTGGQERPLDSGTVIQFKKKIALRYSNPTSLRLLMYHTCCPSHIGLICQITTQKSQSDIWLSQFLRNCPWRGRRLSLPQTLFGAERTQGKLIAERKRRPKIWNTEMLKTYEITMEDIVTQRAKVCIGDETSMLTVSMLPLSEC